MGIRCLECDPLLMPFYWILKFLIKVQYSLSTHHLGLEVDLTIGVRPMVNRFLVTQSSVRDLDSSANKRTLRQFKISDAFCLVLLRLTMLKMILWSTWTFSTEKLNQNLENNLLRMKYELSIGLCSEQWLLQAELSFLSLLYYTPSR